MQNNTYWLLISCLFYTEWVSLSAFSGMHVFSIVWSSILIIFFFSRLYSRFVYSLTVSKLYHSTKLVCIQCTYIWELFITLNTVIELLNKLYVIRCSINESTITIFFLESLELPINICRLAHSSARIFHLTFSMYRKYISIYKLLLTKSSIDLVYV